MAEPPPVDACSLTITDVPGSPETSENLSALAEEPATCKPNAAKSKATKSRWLAVMDLTRGDANPAPGAEDEVTKEDVSKLEMLVSDAIIALEFDYYVLGVALFRLFTTIGFCVIFAILINSGTPNEKMYTQSNAVSSELAPGSISISKPNSTVQFYDIDNVEDVYDWLTDTFTPTVFVATDHTGKTLPSYHLGHLDMANRVLGGVILEMTPREYKSCDSEFVLLELYPMCTYVDSPAKTTDFLDVALGAANAKAVIADLKQSGTWVNYHSKQLAITVATYSGEVSVFTVTRMKINFLETGSIHVESATNSVPDYRGRTWVTIVPVVAVYIFFGLILRYLGNVSAPGARMNGTKSQKNGVRRSSGALRCKSIKQTRAWRLAYALGELCIKFGALPAFATLWTVTISIDFDKQLLRLPETDGKSLEQKYDDIVAVIHKLDTVAAWTNALSIVGAIAVLQLGLFTIRQLSFHPQLSVFARTVVNSLRQFRDFFLVFVIIFFTFSFMGNLLFGGQVREFSTAALSRDSCMNMLFGTFNFDTIYNIRGSGWFYWSYMTIVSLILLNMMLAIVMGTYKAMSKDGYQGEINVMLASRISTIHRYLIQFVLKLPLKHYWARCVNVVLRRKASSRRGSADQRPSEQDGQAVGVDSQAMKVATRELNHDEALAYGKFRPPVLLLVLQRKMKHDPSYSSTTMLTPALLRGLFPELTVSDKEIVATFEFLREGLALNGAVTNQSQTKKLVSGLSKAARLAELQKDLEKLMEQVNKTHKEIQSLTARGSATSSCKNTWQEPRIFVGFTLHDVFELKPNQSGRWMVVGHGPVAMVSSKWLHTRQWSGNLPLYHLLSHDEAELEKRISKVYFASFRFADLRMQIRLKLKELPLNSRSSGSDNPAVYWDILELFDEYLPLLLSIQRYHSAKDPDSTTELYLLTIFPPLLYGFGELNLLSDRLVGKQLRAPFCLPVELALVLYAMGQLYALHAESQISQGGDTLTVGSWPRMQHAEISWQSAESFYRWASAYSCRVKEGMDSSDSVTRPIWRFFEAMATQSLTLSRMSSTHRLSTHISGLSLTEMRPEQLSRIASVCARRALTLVREASAQPSDLTESRFSQQLKWCLSAYEIRWMAVYYQCELAIYRLDANPATSSQQQDSSFSQFAHEIQLKHNTQLIEALDEKKTLLSECRGRFGTTWAFQMLDKSAGAELLSIREMGPVFGEEERFLDAGVEEEESKYASPFLVEVIAANVQEVVLQAKEKGPEADLSSESETILIKKPQKRETKGLTQCHTVTTPAIRDHATARPESRSEPGKRHQQVTSSSHSGQVKTRPASATPQGSGWVTMSYGGKLLHFERSVEPPPHANQSEAGRHQNADSVQEEHPTAINCETVRRSKPRPSSSPCYLSSKKAPKPQPQLEDTNMWAPTRASCALCERRFVRSSLPGVVVMKRVYDLRRKWGVLQDSKKFNAPSVLYGTANVCLLCQEILAHEESRHLSKPLDSKAPQLTGPVGSSADSVVVPSTVGNSSDKDEEVARMIHQSILYRWHQQPPTRAEDVNLEDIATNKRVRQSSTVCSMKAQHALDPDTNRTAHTKEEFQPWWEIDLANYVEVHSVKVYLRDEVSHLYAAGRGLAANPSRRTTGVYPLHLSISMKTGVGRDCDDIVASSVSSLCVTDTMGPPIEWGAPQKSRGRFVRIQCQGRAVLHIEHVHVYVAKPPQKVTVDPTLRRQHVRQKLQRAAFCASVIATTSTVPTAAESNPVVVTAEAVPRRRLSTLAVRTSRRRSSLTMRSKAEREPPLASALFFDPERAEKKRVSRLYARFKSLLDARAKYAAPEEGVEEEEEAGRDGQGG
ncbi:hypothetical protein PHYPSEUDO_007963 [Phytophthora pseudosyringae]|uniref:Polycystin cation channel PKD1/PKD2 domain-containing protein n=1 Tax=Phytophthora pseudosyringae TaxID=221518 RepID=A0A8T1WE27_9STRA|nr:hypothetical protein PHYPSEUDO_007963 [Phytophthora pseudosyringae]